MISKGASRLLSRSFSTQATATSFDPTKFIGKTYEEYQVDLNQRDMILYSLSIGFNEDPINTNQFQFTYEHDKNFQIFPTMNVALALKRFPSFLQIPDFPAVDPFKILHGEEDLEVIKPLQRDNSYIVSEKILDIQDKEKFSSLVVEKSISHKDTKEVHAKVISNFIMFGLSGYGYKGTYKAPSFPKKPETPATQITLEKTHANQALLYRLNGDYNPIHIDPAKANALKFDRPILHGLCTMGFSARSVYTAFANNDPLKVKKVVSRFTSTVFPGESLEVQMWKIQDTNTIYYETKVKERDVTALKGYMHLN
eukprot:403344326